MIIFTGHGVKNSSDVLGVFQQVGQKVGIRGGKLAFMPFKKNVFIHSLACNDANNNMSFVQQFKLYNQQTSIKGYTSNIYFPKNPPINFNPNSINNLNAGRSLKWEVWTDGKPWIK